MKIKIEFKKFNEEFSSITTKFVVIGGHSNGMEWPIFRVVFSSSSLDEVAMAHEAMTIMENEFNRFEFIGAGYFNGLDVQWGSEGCKKEFGYDMPEYFPIRLIEEELLSEIRWFFARR